jgi:hypothetical protein
MSRTRLIAMVVALGVLGAVLLRQAAPGASARPSDVVEREAPVPPVARSMPPIVAPARDIFSYAGDDDDEPAGPVTFVPRPAVLSAPPSLAEPVPTAPSDGPRLIGIVRQGGALRAALSLEGEVVIVRAGEKAGSYDVLAIDEENGIRLQDPSGATVTLAPPPQ